MEAGDAIAAWRGNARAGMKGGQGAPSPSGRDNVAAGIRLAMRVRAYLKIVLVTIAINEVLSVLFGVAVRALDPGDTAIPVVVFSCVTCALVSFWLQADARRAWLDACKRGHVRRSAHGPLPGIAITRECPLRWLVVLHAELNPGLKP